MKLIFFLYLSCFLSLSQLPQTENSFAQQTIKNINSQADHFPFNLEIEEQLEPVNDGASNLFLSLYSIGDQEDIVVLPHQRVLKDSFLSYYSLFTNSPPQII